MLRIANSLRRSHSLQSVFAARLHGSSVAYSAEKSADIPTHTGQVSENKTFNELNLNVII